MQFRHPEVLYALIFLIIPIIVHLFQLQRFVKVPFTNVKFLKNIEQQTRKSSQLKKWLILCARMLALACIILAFSQPYFSNYEASKKVQTTLYIDNSYSMQAKGSQGELLKSITQNIVENKHLISEETTLITNDDIIQKIDKNRLSSELLNMNYQTNPADFSKLLLQLKGQKQTETNTLYNTILISDFQISNFKNKQLFTNVNRPLKLLQASAAIKNNLFVDSIFIDKKTAMETDLKIRIRSTKNLSENIPISLFNDSLLIAKSSAKFLASDQAFINFKIPNHEDIKGRISLQDEGLKFDNNFYFTISKNKSPKVLSIGKKSTFLSKIWTASEFDFKQQSLENLNYNEIQKQQLILLNELEQIPETLSNALLDFLEGGGNLAIIPNKNLLISSYNRLFDLLGIGSISDKIQSNRKITTINYDHPLFEGVFEKKVSNFQYPSSQIHFRGQFIKSATVIDFDNNTSFVSTIPFKESQVYWLASPLNEEDSDFTNSSLVVPLFYNFAFGSSARNTLYHTIGDQKGIEILETMTKDQVLTLKRHETEFIPLQKVARSKVTIDLRNQNIQPGFYEVMNGDNNIRTLAFNIESNESKMTYADLNSMTKDNANIQLTSSIDTLFDEINTDQEINWLFKWFLSFSVLFLLIEMLILKYFKI